MSDIVDNQQIDEVLNSDTVDYYEILLSSLLRIIGSVLVEFVSCSRDLYNLMVCGLISKREWHSTFSRSTLLSIYSNERDLLKRYDNFAVNLLGHNINIKDQFTLWKIRIVDCDDCDEEIPKQYSDSALFILSYLTLIEYYSIQYNLPSDITQFIKLKRIQSSMTVFECAFDHKHLQQFIQNIDKLKGKTNKRHNYYCNEKIRSDNGKKEHFYCKLQHYNEFDKLLEMMENEAIEHKDLLQLFLKNELFLPNLISFKQCWFISIAVKLFEHHYFGYYSRTLNYNAFCIKLESKKIKHKNNSEYIQSFLVWNGVLRDVAGGSVLNKLQFNNANISFLNP